jgi:hypothetical protein
MSRMSWLQRLYWRFLAKPATCRDLFLFVGEQPIHSILEVGMGDGSRIKALMSLLRPAGGVDRLRYASLDPFESEGGSRLTLKEAHRLLNELGVKAHLIPGDPLNGILRVAHTVLPSDLIIIDGHWGDGSEQAKVLEQWLPRLCHSQSGVFASTQEGGRLLRISTPAMASAARTRSQAA